MANWDFSDITGTMFDTGERDNRAIRQLQIQALKNKILKEQQEEQYQTGLESYLQSNMGRTRPSTVTETNAPDLKPYIAAGETGATVPEPQPVTTTKRVPAETTMGGLAYEYASRKGNVKHLLSFEMENRKNRQEEFKSAMEVLKEARELRNDGDPEAANTLIESAKSVNPLLNDIKLSTKNNGKFDVVTVPKKDEKGNILGHVTLTFDQSGKLTNSHHDDIKEPTTDFQSYRSGKKAKGWTEDQISEGWERQKAKIAREGRATGGSTDEGKVQQAKVGLQEAARKLVDEHFRDVVVKGSSKDPNYETYKENILQGKTINPRMYLNPDMQKYYDTISEATLKKSITKPAPQAFREALEENPYKGYSGAGTVSTESKTSVSAPKKVTAPKLAPTTETLLNGKPAGRYRIDGKVVKWNGTKEI